MLNVSASVALNTVLTMQVNGVTVPGGTITLNRETQATELLSASAITAATAGATFSIHASGLPVRDENVPMNLTIVRIA